MAAAVIVVGTIRPGGAVGCCKVNMECPDR